MKVLIEKIKAMKTNISLAQIRSFRNALPQNLKRHQIFIEKAASKGAGLVVFPELSLTGYEPDLAQNSAIKPGDPLIDALQKLAKRNEIIIVAGAPVWHQKGILLASLIFYPDQTFDIYTKHFLHGGEDQYFIPGTRNPVIRMENETISLAICADLNYPELAERAALSGSTFYLVSAFITPEGYDKDSRLLQSYARQYKLNVGLINYSGPSGGIDSAGRTACWSDQGNLINQLSGGEEGLLMLHKMDHWRGTFEKISQSH